MARLFIQLKLSLIAGGLRGAGGPTRLAGLLLALLIALPVTPLAFSFLAAQHGRPGAASIAVITFTGFLLGWLVLPVTTFGVDETLDPARLALLPLRPAVLARGLLAAAFTGIGPVVTGIVAAGAVAAIATNPLSWLVGLIALAIELCLCVIGSRALLTALSGLLRSRRGADLGVLIAGLLGVALFAVNLTIQHSVLTSQGYPGVLRGLRSVAALARWTPPGLTAHAIAEAAAGHYAACAGDLAVGLVTVGLLAWAWITALRHSLEHVESGTATRRSGGRVRAAGTSPLALASGLRGWLRRVSQRRAVVVAGRELRYYGRDPRRRQRLVSLAVPAFLILYARIVPDRAGADPLLIGQAPVAGALAAAYTGMNLLGVEGPALWLTIVSATRWQDLRADLAGKALANATVSLPVLGLLYGVLALTTPDVSVVATAAGLALCGYGTASGVGAVVSILLPVPVPERRSNAFSGGGPGQGCLLGLAILGSLIVTGVLMIPLFVWAGVAHLGGWLLVVGPCYGAVLALAGRVVAAFTGYGRLPEVLAQVSRPV